MAIVETRSDKSNTIYKYESPSKETIFEHFKMISELFDKYLEIHNIDKSNVIVNKKLIGDLIIRVDKRKDYFVIFHDETYINEIKETALLSYWIIKFSPFSINTNNEDIGLIKDLLKYRINEGFAAFLLLGAVKQEYSRAHGKRLAISKEYGKN